MQYIKQCALILFITILISTNLSNAQIFRESGLNKLLSEAEKDTKSAIEYQATIQFHLLLNKYRKTKGLAEVSFDYIYWITCRNHNLWMSKNSLSHSQTKGSINYTGADPGLRLKFVSKASCDWLGENCLMNFSYFETDSINEVAHHIAAVSIEQWKNSKGHNDNMLGTYNNEATAFLITSDGSVWATSLFGWCYEAPKMDDNFRPLSTPSTNIQAAQPETARIKSMTKGEVQRILQSNFEAKSIAPKNHLQKAAFSYRNENNNCISTNLRKRLIISSYGLCLFDKFYKTKEFIFCKTYANNDKIEIEIKEDINAWVISNIQNELRGYGYSLKFKKTDKMIKVTICLIVN